MGASYLRRVSSEAERLVVDRRGAAEAVPEEEFRAWAPAQRVFISSVMEELREERRAVAERVQALGAEPVWFEGFGGRDDDPEVAYISEVASSTIYVGILGGRYGKLLPSRYSATHAEYLAAEQHGPRISVWVSEAEDREGHQQSFLDEVRTFHVTGQFHSPDELADEVERRLRRIASEDLSPWAKLGPLIFRARRVTESGDRIEVAARIRDADVLAGLEALRTDRWGMGFEGSFTYAGRSHRVRVQEVETTTTAGQGAEVRLVLPVQEAGRDPLGDVSVSQGGRTYSPEELTEIALKGSLLGEPAPADLAEHWVQVSNPLEPLSELGLSEETVRPVAHLLLTEALVGGGKASRITRFRLGPAAAGRRRIDFAWEAPRRYTNVGPEERAIEGSIALGK
jgi:hypothetical protein